MLIFREDLNGTKWGELTEQSKEYFRKNMNVWKENDNSNECIFDIAPNLAVAGEIIAEENIIKDDAKIYKPSIENEYDNINVNITIYDFVDDENEVKDSFEITLDDIAHKMGGFGLYHNFLVAKLTDVKAIERRFDGSRKNQHDLYYMANIEWKDINTINLELREFEISELEFSFNVIDIEGEECEINIIREINSRDYDIERIAIR